MLWIQHSFSFKAMLGTMGVSDVNESNIENYIASDSAAVADFIEENFEKFVDEYNMATDDSWDANYIENRFPITIDACGNVYEGVFMDFDNDNGYAVIGCDYEFLDFVTLGASPYADIKSEEYYYSSATGYYYLCKDEYLSVDVDNNAEEDYFYENDNAKHYDGQEKDKKGCGKIIDTDLYVKDKYGSGWSLGNHASLPMRGYTQWDLSCYRKHIIEKDTLSSSTSSEGNCWAVSAYNVLQYMADTKWTDMPQQTDIANYTPSTDEPKIYSKYFDSTGKNKTKLLYYNNKKSSTNEWFLVSYSRSFPELYTIVRKHVNDKYKKIESGSIYNTSEIIEYTAKYYKHNVNAKEHVAWGGYANAATKKLDDGYPLLWSTSSGTYGSHTMAVCGYKYYTKTSGWWIFKSTKYKLFFELRDGHSTAPRFFDLSGHVGFSAIISLEL
ncbi:MAG: hypothetical protein K2N84_07735 [Clostridia bacterium]|nr:hypothetical protein [Clostridia bacterium]